MSDDSDRNIEAIAKLIALTQRGAINWSPVSNDEILARGDISGTASSAFRADFNGRRMQIYLRRYKTQVFASTFFFNQVDSKASGEPKYRWRQEVRFELIDDDGNLLWQFPQTENLKDLHEAIKYKVSGAHDFIQSILDGDA